MKRILLTASIIGLFIAGSMDLQARYTGNDQQRQGRSVVSSSRSGHAPSRNRTNSYGQYDNRQRGSVRGGISRGPSRTAPSRDRYNNYSRYNNRRGRNVRPGISFGLSIYAPMLDRYYSNGRYFIRPGRHVASEIRRNEERIWILEERLERLYRYGGDYREIRQLKQEIQYLARRNDFLRHRRY